MAGNAKNTGPNIEINANAVESRGLSSIPDSVKQTVFGLTTLAATIGMPDRAEAEEVHQVVDTTPRVEGTVDRAFAGLPMTVEEINAQLEKRRVISDVIRRREGGMEFYQSYLDEFQALPEEAQYQIALLINPENGEGGPEYPQETIELIRNLRLPEDMIQAILDEAIANGADEDWDVPAFQEVLIELRNSGTTNSGDTFADLVLLSPETIEKIYFVYAVNTSSNNLVASEGRLDASEGRLDASEGRLNASEETLTILDDAVDATKGD